MSKYLRIQNGVLIVNTYFLEIITIKRKNYYNKSKNKKIVVLIAANARGFLLKN